MVKKSSWFLLLCLSVLLVSCSTLWPPKYPAQLPPARCLPTFPDQDGWYGADGAYSIRLDKQRTLWLFGDTFVAEDVGRKDRIGMDVVMGNTLAISTCSANAEFKIQYYLKKKNGKFTSSFGDNELLWPQDPFIANNVLYIPLLVVQTLPELQPPFNFKITGHKIARIKDYMRADPHQWTVDYLDLTQSMPTGIEALATTSVVHHDYVYFYPLYRHAKGSVNIPGNILVRVPIRNLDNPADALEYLNQDGTWGKKLEPERVKIVLSAGVSELSVRYHAPDQHWMAIYLSPGNKGRQLLYQLAQRPEGPWSDSAALIEAVTEVNPNSALYDKNTFCYAGKEHLEFARERDLVITYVCNSSEDLNQQTSFLRKNLFLYRPVVKKIRR